MGEPKLQTIVQIGSHVGKTFNDPIFEIVNENTNLFCVEPVPYLFKQLVDNYSFRFPGNNFKFINKAVSNHNRGITLYIPSEENEFETMPPWASQLSSCDPQHIEYHKIQINQLVDVTKHQKDLIENFNNIKIDNIQVESITLDELIEQYNITSIDLLNTDTEGHDYEILMKFSFSILPKRVQFEQKHLGDERKRTLVKRIISFGYNLISEDTEDMVFALWNLAIGNS